MNILVIGSGGREHAICTSFRRSSRVDQLFCANGNSGIAKAATCIDIQPDNVAGLVRFAEENAIDLTFVGGEGPLSLGIVDEFESRDLAIIGPTSKAAQLEASKSFAKDFMARHGVPTAKYVTARSHEEAVLSLQSGEFGDGDDPVVVKADGLAAGKGVVVAQSRAEAIHAINEMNEIVGSSAAETLVLEECLTGKEVSLLMFADGEDFALMPATRDHKRIGEGDTGPNSGGMGTVTDASLLNPDDLETVIGTVIRPTLRGCSQEGYPFRGILFLGLMMTSTGPKLLEYNVRFGDPETQAILVRLETDLAEICTSMLAGTLSKVDIKWRPGSSACVVLASRGYPTKPQTGDVIRGIDEAAAIPGIEIFHAGTKFNEVPAAPGQLAGSYATAGGRVLGVTATGDDLDAALELAYSAVDRIAFDGMQFRRDIGRT